MITTDSIRYAVQNGNYSAEYPADLTYEKLAELPLSPVAKKAIRLKHREQTRRLETQFVDDLVAAIKAEQPKLNDATAARLAGHAWQECHSAGLEEVIQHAEQLIDLLRDL